MSITISGLPPATSFAPAESSSSAPAAQTAQPAVTSPPYTVELTEAQQVYNLYNRGQSVPQIATSLSLPEAAVNNYLGISGS